MEVKAICRRVVFNLPEFSLAVLAIAITILVFFELCIRELFHISVFGVTSDLTHFCMVWISMLGAAVAAKRGSHFVFPILAQRFGPVAAPYLSIFSTLTIMTFAAVMLIIGTRVALFSLNESYVAIPVSLFWQNLAMPVSASLMLIYCAVILVGQLRDLQSGKKSRSSEGQH